MTNGANKVRVFFYVPCLHVDDFFVHYTFANIHYLPEYILATYGSMSAHITQPWYSCRYLDSAFTFSILQECLCRINHSIALIGVGFPYRNTPRRPFAPPHGQTLDSLQTGTFFLLQPLLISIPG